MLPVSSPSRIPVEQHPFDFDGRSRHTLGVKGISSITSVGPDLLGTRLVPMFRNAAEIAVDLRALSPGHLPRLRGRSSSVVTTPGVGQNAQGSIS